MKHRERRALKVAVWAGIRNHIIALSILGVACAALVSPRLAIADEACSFDYVAADGLIATDFKEVTQAAVERPELMRTARATLPNVRRIFAAEARRFGVSLAGGYTAMIGWAELPEDYSQYSDLQAERKFVEMAERTKRTVYAGKDFTYETGFEMPLSMVMVANYLDGGERYRDIGMDVIANKNCMFSIKVSGARRSNDDAAWQAFLGEFGRIRSALKSHEEPIAFSKTGKIFSFWGIVNVTIYVAAGAVIGAIFAFVLKRQYQIVPGKAAQRYSLAIIVLCLFMLVFAGLMVSTVGPAFETYDGVWLILIILTVHANAYIRRSPMAVLTAMSLVFGLFVVSAVYMALGWRAFPRTAEVVAMAIGLAMLLYAFAGTLSRTTNTTEQPRQS
jgi:hypothetical protein